MPLPLGVVFTFDEDFDWSVISAADIAHAESVTTCAHGERETKDCQRCSVASLFHRQIYRMFEWFCEQKGYEFDPDVARRLADERTREHVGFVPIIGDCPPQNELPALPPIDISKIGLVVVPAPVEGNNGTIALRIQRPDGAELNQVQSAILEAIAKGAAWVPGAQS